MTEEASEAQSWCPFCLAPINTGARRCRHCGSDLQYNPRRYGDERVTYVLDRGLVRFAKFAAATLAIFVVVGTYMFGLDISKLIEEMRDVRAQMDSEKERLITTRNEIRDALEQLNTAKLLLKDAHVSVAETREESKTIASEARNHLIQIEMHLSQAGVVVASILEMRRTLLPEQQALAKKERQEISAGAPDQRQREAKLWPVGQTLRVRLIGGSDDSRLAVQHAADEWEKYANVNFEFVADDGEAEIRIGFHPRDGSWSLIGTDALGLMDSQEERTINFGWDLTTPYGKDTALQILGQALGLVNEHQNPSQAIKWNAEAVYEAFSGPPNNWQPPHIERELLTPYSHEEYPGERPLDPDSIMMIRFKAGLIIEPVKYQTEPLIPARGLSDSDKDYIATLYPKP